jgi:uncharacterized protein YndB with AHSA1/START domain
MTERKTTHATFTIERTLDAPPGRVFGAWADPAAKTRWFVGNEETVTAPLQMDFRSGGRESAAGKFHDGPVSRYDATYYDIVADQRIVVAYEMHLDDVRISVSLATVELAPAGAGTKMTFTEQGAYLDGYDDVASRRRGTEEMLDNLERELRRTAVGA